MPLFIMGFHPPFVKKYKRLRFYRYIIIGPVEFHWNYDNSKVDAP
jgi:hypothetical protein